MLQPRWGLGPLSIVIALIVTLTVVGAIVSLVRNPPRQRLVVWPASFVFAYVVCIVPLVIVLSSLHVPLVETTNAFACIVLVLLMLIVVRRPNRLAFLGLSAAFLFFWTSYAVAFWSATQGSVVTAVVGLLGRPVWIATFLGQSAELVAAVLLAAIAIGRPDLFRKAEPADVFQSDVRVPAARATRPQD